MKGVILDFSIADNQGVVSGDDGNRYTFVGKEWKSSTPPTAGMRVDYDVEGRTALGVYADLAVAVASAQSVPSNVPSAKGVPLPVLPKKTDAASDLPKKEGILQKVFVAPSRWLHRKLGGGIVGKVAVFFGWWFVLVIFAAMLSRGGGGVKMGAGGGAQNLDESIDEIASLACAAELGFALSAAMNKRGDSDTKMAEGLRQMGSDEISKLLKQYPYVENDISEVVEYSRSWGNSMVTQEEGRKRLAANPDPIKLCVQVTSESDGVIAAKKRIMSAVANPPTAKPSSQIGVEKLTVAPSPSTPQPEAVVDKGNAAVSIASQQTASMPKEILGSWGDMCMPIDDQTIVIESGKISAYEVTCQLKTITPKGSGIDFSASCGVEGSNVAETGYIELLANGKLIYETRVEGSAEPVKQTLNRCERLVPVQSAITAPTSTKSTTALRSNGSADCAFGNSAICATPIAGNVQATYKASTKCPSTINSQQMLNGTIESLVAIMAANSSSERCGWKAKFGAVPVSYGAKRAKLGAYFIGTVRQCVDDSNSRAINEWALDLSTKLANTASCEELFPLARKAHELTVLVP